MAELLGLHPQIFDGQALSILSLRLLISLVFSSIVIFGVYVRLYGRSGFVFTYFMFNVITFTLCFMLQKVNMELGFALGLFAVFGILRYRTETIQTRDLTYLFVVIGLAIINAVVGENVRLVELLLVNVAISGLTAVLEYSLHKPPLESHEVVYDNLQLIQQQGTQALVEDLRSRTGLSIEKVKIERIDLLRDTVYLIIYYKRED